MARITRQNDDTTFDCAEDDTILRAALRAGIGMPYSCNTGSCGNCRFELKEGAVEHLREDPPAWSERDLKRNRYLGCQAAPRGDCVVKFRAMDDYVPPHRPAIRKATLRAVTKITRDISDFAFEIEGDAAFEPGQYALLHVPGVDGGRAYSMSNLGEDGTWRFMIKDMPGGAATDWLFAAEPGAELVIDGPYGTAYLRPDVPRDIVLMAGGSGLSPMVSIARAALKHGLLDDRKLHLFYGCRDEPDLFDTDMLGDDLLARITCTPALSEPGTGAAWTGATGYLHDVVRDHMGEALAECEIYFAGPAVMAAAIQKMAHEAGVPMDRLHFDEFY
ncbi:2Fe-2S iron-sulfur cluster-binding protein [Citreimonas sp.]|uniref:2Fe-2S iron-sulfur cluster-binding protein n=1 Tax=Citreimonas sp. TaxID=3036715 RepID=UPI0035C7ABBB